MHHVMGNTAHLLLLVFLVGVLGNLCAGGNTCPYDSKKKLCYGFEKKLDASKEAKIFGVLSKQSNLEIHHVYPFNSASLPKDERVFSSSLFLQEYLQKNKELLQQQRSFLDSNELSTVNSNKIPFYHAEDMPKPSRDPRQSFALNCVTLHRHCQQVVQCKVHSPEDGVDVGQALFYIKPIRKTSRVYLTKLKMKYQEMFMYVGYGRLGFQDASAGCLTEYEDDANLQFLSECTRDSVCHSLVVQGLRPYAQDFSTKCDHEGGCCRLAGNPLGECGSFALQVFYKILELYAYRGESTSWAEPMR